MRISLPKFENENGIATATVMIFTIIIVTISTYIIQAARGMHNRPVEDFRYYSTIELVKANVYEVASNPTAWFRTVNQAANSTSLACVRTNALCTGGNGTIAAAFRDVELYFPDNTFYAGNAGTTGFDLQGKACSTYSATNINTSQGCVIKANIKWRPYCNADCYVSPPSTTPPYASITASPSGGGYNRGFFYISASTADNQVIPANDGYDFKSLSSALWGMPQP